MSTQVMPFWAAYRTIRRFRSDVRDSLDVRGGMVQRIGEICADASVEQIVSMFVMIVATGVETPTSFVPPMIRHAAGFGESASTAGSCVVTICVVTVPPTACASYSMKRLSESAHAQP